MASSFDSTHTQFSKLRIDVPVRYKFLSKEIDLGDDSVYEGSTCKLSPNGLLLVGKIPSLSWIPALLMGKILIGVNVLLPNATAPIKALARVSWIEEIPEGHQKCTLGLTFKEISKEQQDEILKFMIRSQITPRK